MEGGRDPYRVLGVARDATNEEIRRAFQVLAKEKHPDANKGSGVAAEFQAVKEAYDLLKDPGRRKVYDFTSSSTRAGLYTAYSDPAEAERLRQRADEFRRRYQNPGALLLWCSPCIKLHSLHLRFFHHGTWWFVCSPTCRRCIVSTPSHGGTGEGAQPTRSHFATAACTGASTALMLPAVPASAHMDFKLQKHATSPQLLHGCASAHA